MIYVALHTNVATISHCEKGALRRSCQLILLKPFSVGFANGGVVFVSAGTTILSSKRVV